MRRHNPWEKHRIRCPLAKEYASFRQTCWMVLSQDQWEGFHLPDSREHSHPWEVTVAIMRLIAALLR